MDTYLDVAIRDFELLMLLGERIISLEPRDHDDDNHQINFIDEFVQGIRDNLAIAGVDASALAPDRGYTDHSAQAMDGLIDRAVVGLHIRCAGNDFKRLSGKFPDIAAIDRTAQDIRDHFNRAGVDAAALNEPYEDKSAQEMETRIDDAVATAKEFIASRHF